MEKQQQLLINSKIREYIQLKLKDTFTAEAANDLENLQEGTPEYKTIINMIDNKMKQVISVKHNSQQKKSQGASSTLLNKTSNIPNKKPSKNKKGVAISNKDT